MDGRNPKLLEIWSQKKIPVLFKRQRPPLLVRLPYANNHTNSDWIRNGRRANPSWSLRFKCWETPVSWFDDLIQRALEKFGRVYVIQLYKEQQKCAPACWNAEGFHCECSCMGANHGSGHPGGNWREITDTFAFSWGPKQYACRLITATGGSLKD